PQASVWNQSRFAGCESKNRSRPSAWRSRREVEGAFVEARGPRFFTTHPRPQYSFKHILLQAAYDRKRLKQIHHWRMTLEYVWTAVGIRHKLGHVAIAVTNTCERLRTIRNRVRLYFIRECSCSSFKNTIEQFFGTIRSVNLTNRVQQFQGELVAVGLEEIVGPLGQSIYHFGSAHFLGPTPG